MQGGCDCHPRSCQLWKGYHGEVHGSMTEVDGLTMEVQEIGVGSVSVEATLRVWTAICHGSYGGGIHGVTICGGEYASDCLCAA